MHAIIEWAFRYRAIVLMGVVLTVAFGIYSLQQLPIDAVPDITPNQVLVLTRAPSLSPVEVEQFLTFPIETAMTGLPGVERIQSVSKNGLSYVAVYFKEDVDTYFARRLVMERLPQARENIPAGMGSPEMGPIATGLGEVLPIQGDRLRPFADGTSERSRLGCCSQAALRARNRRSQHSWRRVEDLRSTDR